MKKIKQIYKDDNITESVAQKIIKHVKELDSYSKVDKQKQLELCQVGKFLATFFPEYHIKEVREVPDFIITNGNIDVGLEHEIITNVEIREQYGFYENIFHLVERDIQSNNELPNFLANCYLKSNLNFNIKDKKELVKIIKEVVLTYILRNEIPENPIIDYIAQMPHSRKCLQVNFGPHMVQELSNDIIHKFIKNKEIKVEKYYNETGLNQWLVLVAGGVTKYSYDIPDKLNLGQLNTKFQKVFILADFKNKLYKLK